MQRVRVAARAPPAAARPPRSPGRAGRGRTPRNRTAGRGCRLFISESPRVRNVIRIHFKRDFAIDSVRGVELFSELLEQDSPKAACQVRRSSATRSPALGAKTTEGTVVWGPPNSAPGSDAFGLERRILAVASLRSAECSGSRWLPGKGSARSSLQNDS
jgi:hypothetical protein